jgi:uncharacterized protein (DUF2147 family)
MKRSCFLAVLTLLSSPAYAAEQVSFVVAGHRIHIEASRFCRSVSCASVSISGIYQSRRSHDRFDEDDRDPVAPVKAPEAVASVTAPPPTCNPPVRPVVPAAPPAIVKPAAVAAQEVAASPPPQIQPARIAPPSPPVDRPAEAARPAPAAAAPISKVAHEAGNDPADTPIGDWQTEAKGSVRIAPCGRALCGYVLNSSSNDKGEAVLINMKPNSNSKWAGNVYSHDSGDTYFGTMDMTGPNTLRVKACALGRFYCSGNAWSRIFAKPERLISTRQISQEPRS